MAEAAELVSRIQAMLHGLYGTQDVLPIKMPMTQAMIKRDYSAHGVTPTVVYY